MSRRSFYNPVNGGGETGFGPKQNAERVWAGASDIERQGVPNQRAAPHNGALRRVNAAQGEDLTQKYDPFGHNKFSDAANPWAAFFGAPAAPWKTASYDKYDRNNYALPEAYVGQNEYLGRTIDNLIYTDETFYTQVLMPIKYTPQVSVAWDTWTFNEHFTGIVPEMGVSRLVSSKRETHSDSFVRRGLAAIFEHGFMSTPEGRAHYIMTLAQIARAVQETINFGVIYAYLTCHDYSKEYQSKHGYFKRETLQDILNRENFMWAIAVKAEFGMEKLDAQIIEWMADHRTDADTWVLPPKPAMYLRLVPEEKVYYYKAGQEGPNRVNGIVSAGRPHEANAPSKRTQDIVEPYDLFKKNAVYISRSYNVDQTGPIDLLNRMSSVGEYFKIVATGNDCEYGNKYMTCYTDTRIFDEDGDCGYTATMMEGLKHCQVFNDDGTPRVLDGLSSPIDAADLRQVFWLRPEIDATGAETFKNIEIMGDIDSVFFSIEDVANLARTWIRSMLGGRKKTQEVIDLDNRLTAGAQLISRLSTAPINGTSGTPAAGGTTAQWNASIAGMTTYAGLSAISATNAAFPEVAVARDYLAALDIVTSKLQSTMGGNTNMFLNPANSLSNIAAPGSGTAARTLHENLFNYSNVPLFSADDGSRELQGDVAATLEEGLRQIRSVLRPIRFKTREQWAALGVDEDRYTAAFAAATDDVLLVDDAGFRKVINDALDFMNANPAVVKGARTEAEARTWVANVRQLIAQAPTRQARRVVLGTGPGGAVVPTQLAVSRTHPQFAEKALKDGTLNLRALGFVPASRLDLTKPAAVFDTGAPDYLPVTIGANARVSMFENMPVLHSVLNAGGDEQQQQQGRGGAPRTRGFESLFADDDAAEPIGSLLGGGKRMHQRTREIAERHTSYIAKTGVVLQEGFDARLRFGTLADNLEQLEVSSMSGLERAVAAVYFAAPWRRQTLEGLLTRNVMPNFGLLGFRIGLYDMALGIKCKAGSETAITYFGNSRFMLSDDATTMMHYGNYTHYGKSIVHKPGNVFVAYDIFPNRCLGGMGVRPYEKPSEYNAAQGLNTRDIFYVMVPYAEKKFPTVMDMAGRFYSYMDSGMLDDEDPANRELHYSTAAFYNRRWGWYSDEDVTTQVDEPLYRLNNPGQNRIVWQGAQGTFKPEDGSFNKNIIRNKSPWGQHVYEGCRAVRDGRMERSLAVPFGILGF